MKQKRKGHSKISEEINKSLYNWIIHHPKVMKYPISNDYLRVKVDGYTELQLVPTFYCMCLPENFITILLATQNILD